MTCKRCRRTTCKAQALGKIAVSLGFPERMRLAVTTAQDECDYVTRELKLAQRTDSTN